MELVDHTSRLLLCLGYIGEAEMGHAILIGFGQLLGAGGTGKAAVGGGRDSTTLRTVVQRSPGGTGRHDGKLKGT